MADKQFDSFLIVLLIKIKEMGDDNKKEQEKLLFNAYSEHTKVLRAWLAAYAIGVPLLLLNNDGLRTTLLSCNQAHDILKYFAFSIALQVLITLINKIVNWINYSAAYKNAEERNNWENIADTISTWFLIDFVVDILALYYLVISTLLLFDVYFPKHCHCFNTI